MALVDRFSGTAGASARRDALATAKLVGGNPAVAEELLDEEVVFAAAGQELVTQGDDDTDLYVILAGNCRIEVNHTVVASRGPGDHVGEMAAIQPSQLRSASVVASEELVALKIGASRLKEVGDKFPEIYRYLAQELARRLLSRNSNIGLFRDTIRVFIVCSVESLSVAQAVQNAFEYDDFTVTVWTDGVFRVASYPLEALEEAVEKSDFAIAIAHPDDKTVGRHDEVWPSPRDNVVFELGLFMGRLGRSRAILMEPRDRSVKLPSDLTGITTVTYRLAKGPDLPVAIAPACNKLREHIKALGPNNG